MGPSATAICCSPLRVDVGEVVEKPLPHAKSNLLLGRRGIERQGNCPVECKGEMSSQLFSMPVDYDTTSVVRERVMGGLPAPMELLTLSLCMPRVRTAPRMGSPLRF